MPKGTNQKLKLFYLYKILLQETDDDHSINLQTIREKLERYDVTAERRSLYNDMETMRDVGLDVQGKQIGRDYYYHIGEKRFQIAELKLLVDAIQSSKFITEKKSRELIKKLTGFASKYEAKQLRRQVVVQGRIKTMNESIYYNVDELHNAISQNSRITFTYLQWNLKKRLVPRKKERYEVSPWGLLWDDENYYLVAYDPKAKDNPQKGIKHYRVDKMTSIEMTGEPREGEDCFKEFDLASYSKKNFGMFGGKEVKVRLRFRNEFVGVILDRFGKDIFIMPSKADGWSETSVDVALSDQFFGWIFSLGKNVKIIGPQEVVEQFRGEMKEMGEFYGG